MDVNETTDTFRSHLSPEPLVGISVVAQNMHALRSQYKNVHLEQFESFGFSYHAVTTTIEDQVNQQRMYGMRYFKQPQVLDTAIGIFHHKYTEPFRAQLEGDPIKPHWNVLMKHELAAQVDRGTQAALGYIAHIGADLAPTVYETAQSGRYDSDVMRDYVKHDYSKIDDSLGLAARKIAPKLIAIENPKVTDAIVKVAMSGIILGRKYARHDFRRLMRAKSQDEREFILHNAEQRTAKVGIFVLEKSHAINASYRMLNAFRKNETVPIDRAA